MLLRRVVLVVVVLGIARGENELTYEKEDGIVILTERNFDHFLKNNPTTLVEFYAPWCGHCKSLAPEYSKAAEELSIPLAKVDATVETKLSTRFDIQGFPTLKFWQESEDPIAYDGARDKDGIVQWVLQRTDPNYKPPKEEVVTLVTEVFDDVVASHALALVEFYAPWCGHCKKLAPEYEKAAKTLRAKGSEVLLAKVDATVEKTLADKYAVKGFPTLLMFRNGKRFEYKGPREAAGIVNYMLVQSKPAAKKISTVKEAQRMFLKDDVTILGFFSDERSNMLEAFTDAAEKTREEFRAMGYTTNEEVMKHFKAKPDSLVIFHPEIFWSKYEPKRKVFSESKASAEDVLAYLNEHSAPLVGRVTRDNMVNRYSKLPLVVVYYNVDFSLEYRDGTQYWRNKVVELANKYKTDKYRFAIADELEFAGELREVGLGDSGLEQNVIVFGANGKKYPMDPDEFDDDDLTENLNAFMDKISSGKAKPHEKSQPVPKGDKGPVKTLVASNFHKIALDESKDVLIEFYAPWCGHCKEFEPKYKEIAAKLKAQEPNLILAKFDATANDHPQNFAVEGFPTLYFAPSGKKDSPVQYKGNRDEEDLMKFMKDNAVVSFKGKTEL